ncbi:MAG: hypothetical protein KGH98_01555 [Candidatus Micrarchaeota archaeon]|nr:hypothetical protein [Candidatus Micrarchaeota archaeon]
MATFRQHKTTRCEKHYQIEYSLMGGFPVIEIVKQPKSVWSGTGAAPRETEFTDEWDVKSLLHKAQFSDLASRKESALYLLQLELRPNEFNRSILRQEDFERPRRYMLLHAERAGSSFEFGVVADWSKLKWMTDRRIMADRRISDVLSEFVQKHHRSRDGFEFLDWWEDGLFELRKVPYLGRTHVIESGDLMCWRNYEGESCDSVVRIRDGKTDPLFLFVKSYRWGTEWSHNVEEADYDYVKLATAHHLLPVGTRG